MKGYRLLPHTADVRLLVEGDSLEALFTAALEGVNSILKRDGIGRKEAFPIKEPISLVASNVTMLLIDFLSEVVSRSYANRVLFYKVFFSDLTPVSLVAELGGIPVKEFDEDIKAVTYHEAQVVKNNRGIYETTIVLDI